MSEVMRRNDGRTNAGWESGMDPEAPPLTREGRKLLEARVRRLREEVLPVLVDAMRDSEDDGREAAEYVRAADELRRLSGILAGATPIGEPRGTRVQLGDELELRSPGRVVERFLIVHPAEAPLDERRISAESPLGRAVLGRGPGEEIVVAAPGEPYRCRLLRWTRGPSSRTLVAEVMPG
jgi:transcription elongation factor GreA